MEAPTAPSARLDRRRLTGILLALLAVVTAVVLLAGSPHLFVALTSDREGEAILPVSTLAPGSATTGELTLANEGLLPLRYDLRIQGGRDELDSGVIIRIRRGDAVNYLYQGPLSSQAIPIGTLLPGQRDRLEVTLAAPPSEATASVPIDDTFVWTAHPPDIASWWWLLLVVAALVAGAFGLPRMLATWVWLRARRRMPFELYYRPPLVLSVVLLATLAPLSGASLTSINLQTSNPAGRFAIGALVLSDQSPSRTSCLSIASPSAESGPAGSCDAIFQFAQGAPGRVGVGRVVIRNVGTVPITRFDVSTRGCESRPAAAFHGTADGCAAVLMTIHDDRHDVCYYPARLRGGCPLGAAGTMRGFATDHPSGSPLALDPEGLGSGITFTFTVEVDPGAGNSAQGLSPVMDFDWRVAQ